MNNVDKFQEDVEIGVQEQTLQIPVRIKMSSLYDTPFDFTVSIDDLGQIILTPMSKDVAFLQANTEDSIEYDIPIMQQKTIVSNESENYKEQDMSIVINATMLVETNSTNKVSADIDEIGQCVIYPMSKENNFITAAIGDSLNLITEDAEVEVPQEVEASVVIENIDTTSNTPFTEEQLDAALRQITYDYNDVDGGIYCDSSYEQETCAKILSKHYPQVSTGIEKDHLTVFYSRDTDVLTEEVDSDSLMDILVRFLQGNITLVSDASFEPKDSFVHLKQVDTDTEEYYYDPESDVIGIYKKK